MKPDDPTSDIDRLFALYKPDGSASWTTARDLMSAGNISFEQIAEAERHSTKFYKPIHDALEAARKSRHFRGGVAGNHCQLPPDGLIRRPKQPVWYNDE
jgi:hypothetical protein